MEQTEFWLEKQKHILDFMSFIEGIRWKFVGAFSVSAIFASVFNVYFRVLFVKGNTNSNPPLIDPNYIIYLIVTVCVIAISVQIRIYGLFKQSWDSYGEIDKLLKIEHSMHSPQTSIPMCYQGQKIWSKLLSVHMSVCTLFSFITFLNFHIAWKMSENGNFKLWEDMGAVMLSVIGSYVLILVLSELYLSRFKSLAHF